MTCTTEPEETFVYALRRGVPEFAVNLVKRDEHESEHKYKTHSERRDGARTSDDDDVDSRANKTKFVTFVFDKKSEKYILSEVSGELVLNSVP